MMIPTLDAVVPAAVLGAATLYLVSLLRGASTLMVAWLAGGSTLPLRRDALRRSLEPHLPVLAALLLGTATALAVSRSGWGSPTPGLVMLRASVTLLGLSATGVAFLSLWSSRAQVDRADTVLARAQLVLGPLVLFACTGVAAVTASLLTWQVPPEGQIALAMGPLLVAPLLMVTAWFLSLSSSPDDPVLVRAETVAFRRRVRHALRALADAIDDGTPSVEEMS